MNKCDGCGREFFYLRSKGGTKNECNTCSTNRRRFLLRIKIITYLGSKCVECGYDLCFGALHAHHVDPLKKEFTISGAHSRSWDKIKQELDKCILLCANCHTKNHHDCDRYNCGSIPSVL